MKRHQLMAGAAMMAAACCMIVPAGEESHRPAALERRDHENAAACPDPASAGDTKLGAASDRRLSPELIELSGRLRRTKKQHSQLELIPQGQIERFDLRGDVLRDLPEGVPLRVRGVMRSRLDRGDTGGAPSPTSPQWTIWLEVTELEVLGDPQDILKKHASTTATKDTSSDPLADLFRIADTDAAIERLVADSPKSWVKSTSLEEFQYSESEFRALGRVERRQLLQKIYDRISDIKTLARAVVDRAQAAKKRGDDATANRYLRAVNCFGEQLRDSDLVIVFQQTGKALADVTLDE